MKKAAPKRKTKAKPKAAKKAAPTKKAAPGKAPKPAAGAPDLAWLVSPESKKLRALLRTKDQSKIHGILAEAGVLGKRNEPIMDPDTARALTAPLIAALSDGAEIVRANAAWLLGTFGPAQAGEPLARLLAADASTHVRRRAAEALGRLVPSSPASVEPLVAALTHPGTHMDDTDLRRNAARALNRVAPLDPTSAPSLLAAVEVEHPGWISRGDATVMGQEPDWHMAELLAPVLARIGAAALPALRTALANERGAARGLAVMAVCRLIWRGDAPSTCTWAADLTKPLEALLDDDVETVRAHAAVALAALHPARAKAWLEPVGEALTTAMMSWTVRLQAIEIVRALGAAARPLFPRMLFDRMHPGGVLMRRSLLAALGLGARDLMTAAVNSGKIEAPEMAVWLAQVGAPDAFDRLSDIDAGDTGDATDSNMLRHQLVARTGPRGVAAALARLADAAADPDVPACVVRGLRAMAAAERQPLLEAGMKAPSPHARAMAAALALVDGHPGAAATLEALWPDDDERVMEGIAVMHAPATAFLDRLLALVEGRTYRYYVFGALAAVAAVLPEGAQRTHALATLAHAYGEWGSRDNAEFALARAGITRGFEDPNAFPWDEDV
jgi:HEAT repeat protein